MSLDRITQRAYLDEIAPRLLRSRVEKVRTHGPWSLKLDLSTRDSLFIDVSRSAAGVWLMPRASRIPADPRDVLGPSRTAALLFKKHLEGARIDGIESTPQREILLRTSRGTIVVRAHGAPCAGLFPEDGPPAMFGLGEPVAEAAVLMSQPDFDESRAIDLVQSVASAMKDDRRDLLVANDPGLAPLLRRWPADETSIRNLSEVIAGTRRPEPYLLPEPTDDAACAEVPPMLLPFSQGGDARRGTTFASAGERLYAAVRRADLFRERFQSQHAKAKSEVARLSRLRGALERDRGRWPDPSQMRLQAEALLAAPSDIFVAKGRDAVTITIPDPRTGGTIDARIQPAMTLPQNANALYAKARAIEKQKGAFDERWSSVISSLGAAEQTLARVKGIRSLEELDDVREGPAAGQSPGGGRSRYLTSRGLEILFGRSASENHEVTFKLARREDIWFHVLDAPGGHVVLRNRDGRANKDDIAQAASLAAFLSERRTEANVDVQYTERKHVHPAGGGKGRVRVAHSEVIRVAPQDPVGRLRAR